MQSFAKGSHETHFCTIIVEFESAVVFCTTLNLSCLFSCGTRVTLWLACVSVVGTHSAQQSEASWYTKHADFTNKVGIKEKGSHHQLSCLSIFQNNLSLMPQAQSFFALFLPAETTNVSVSHKHRFKSWRNHPSLPLCIPAASPVIWVQVAPAKWSLLLHQNRDVFRVWKAHSQFSPSPRPTWADAHGLKRPTSVCRESAPNHTSGMSTASSSLSLCTVTEEPGLSSWCGSPPLGFLGSSGARLFLKSSSSSSSPMQQLCVTFTEKLFQTNLCASLVARERTLPASTEQSGQLRQRKQRLISWADFVSRSHEDPRQKASFLKNR